MAKSKWKIPFVEKTLLNKKNKTLKIYNRDSILLSLFQENNVLIYNGKNWIKFKWDDKMLKREYKIGEFANTRKKCVYKVKKK